MQRFKQNDPIERKVTDCFSPMTELIENMRTEFFDGAYTSYGLGEAIFNIGADPMARSSSKETYLESYPAFHELFKKPGTFDFFLGVFRSVWGDDVEVEFSIPTPGHLVINIEALESRADNWTARSIVDNEYIYDNMVDHVGDNLMFQAVNGVKTQQEVDTMMAELSVQGIFTETTLTIV